MNRSTWQFRDRQRIVRPAGDLIGTANPLLPVRAAPASILPARRSPRAAH